MPSFFVIVNPFEVQRRFRNGEVLECRSPIEADRESFRQLKASAIFIKTIQFSLTDSDPKKGLFIKIH